MNPGGSVSDISTQRFISFNGWGSSKMYTQFQKRLFAFVLTFLFVLIMLSAVYTENWELFGEIISSMLIAGFILVMTVLCERSKVEKDETPRVRARCPFCDAIYAYSLESAIETGTYHCQNCLRIFTVQSN